MDLHLSWWGGVQSCSPDLSGASTGEATLCRLSLVLRQETGSRGPEPVTVPRVLGEYVSCCFLEVFWVFGFRQG